MAEFPSLYIRSTGPLLDDVTDMDLGDVDLLPLRPSSVTLEMVTGHLAKATIVVLVTPDVDVPAEVTLVNAAEQ